MIDLDCPKVRLTWHRSDHIAHSTIENIPQMGCWIGG